jgi:hypothetical protein
VLANKDSIHTEDVNKAYFFTYLTNKFLYSIFILCFGCTMYLLLVASVCIMIKCTEFCCFALRIYGA